jgi:hypothetical protein
MKTSSQALQTALKTQIMKNLTSAVVVLILTLGWSFKGAAQTVQYVTITGTYPSGNNLPVQTNQIVSVVGYDWFGGAGIVGTSQNGTNIIMNLSGYIGSAYAVGSQIPQIFTGLTNISVIANTTHAGYPGAATFQITTPATATVISNYVPADAIVIPSSATGNVQIILESSPDLVNWTAASPGTYGASAGTNRFFRVRAVVN